MALEHDSPDGAMQNGYGSDTPPDPRDRKIVELERETRRLTSRLERAEALVDLQKKVSQLLGIVLPERDDKP